MSYKKTSGHGEWSSRFAFILAATGSAVGLGNIWKFPYITGQNGGGAFVLVYLLCVAGIGLPIMMAEIMMGRRGHQDPISTMQLLAHQSRRDPRWQYLGGLGVLAGFLIMSYYSVIAGWSLSYIVKTLFGYFINTDAIRVKHLFEQMMANPLQQIIWHSVFMAATLLVVVRGVRAGLERSVRFLMPALFIILMLLIAYAMTSGSYQQGLDFLFHADFSKIDSHAVLTAMGHAFFTLSLGMGSIMVYGSYLPRHISIPQTTLIIAGADTLVALLAGLAIFPLVFANNLEVASGPGLIFQTLPLAFGQMTGGWLFGILFFILLFFAALTSSISLIEPAIAWLTQNRQLSREQACIRAGLSCWLLGIAVVFSFNIGSEYTLMGKNLFELLDYLTANLMLPLGGMGIAIFAGWKMHTRDAERELGLSAPLFLIWQFLCRYLAPGAVFLVFLHVVGIL